MAFRVSSSRSSLSSPARPGLSLARIERGVSAFGLTHSEDTPLAKTYRGKAAIFEFSFPAIPGLTGAIVAGVKGSAFISPQIRSQILRIEVWQDKEPTFDRYHVRVWIAGEIPDSENGAQGTVNPRNPLLPGGAEEVIEGVGAGPLLIPLGAIVTILLFVIPLTILGVIAWKLSKVDFGKATEDVTKGLVIVGVIAVVAWLVLRSFGERGKHGAG